MGEPFKNLVNEKLINRLVGNIKEAYSAFDAQGFTAFVLDDTFVNLELKQRVNRVAEGLNKFLPQDYKQAIAIIDKVVSKYGLETDDWQAEFCWFFPSFIEYYGTHDWETSIATTAFVGTALTNRLARSSSGDGGIGSWTTPSTGLVFRWGESTTQTVTFSTAFPNTCGLVAYIGHHGALSSSTSIQSRDVGIRWSDVSRTGFTWQRQSGTADINRRKWLAIGW